MKRYYLLGLILFVYLSLIGCASNRNPMLNADLTNETWMRAVDTNPMRWMQGADRWFFTGEPNATEMANRNASSALISTTSMNVTDFTRVRVNGDFQVQIFGTYGHNSVYVYGPNDAVRQVNIEVHGDTLCISQAKTVSRSMGRVIIRIGMAQLTTLIQQGCGTIEGIRLRGMNLFVASSGRGNIYLSGNLCVQRILNMGPGCITLLGANTPALAIRSMGRGSVNVCGNVGIKTLQHHGTGDINIIGANSAGLSIFADGCGKIGIKGIVNLCELRARDRVHVYVYTVKSNTLYVYVNDKASVGLAGSVQNLYVDTCRSACFAGKYLCAIEAFVRAHDNSHINIAASSKVFAAATENASAYFFGSPTIMSQFISGNGTVIPVWSGGGCCTKPCAVQPRRPPISYKGENISFNGEVYFPRTRVKRESRWERVR